jgi:AcrR family transcriptional regulator
MQMAASPATARAASAELTRRRLIDAAIERFAADGLGAPFDAVAADVGVTKGALYHHFGSKDGLVEAVYREAVNRHAVRVIDATSSGDGRTRVLALIDASARLYTSRTPFYRLLTSMHLESTTARPHLAAIARRVQRSQREYMIGLVRTGQRDGSIRATLDAEAAGLTLNAALEGFLVQQLEPQSAQRRWIAKFRTLMEDML